ncbi:hypothetical protein CJ195_24480 [Bacillus sp. UMB0899]|uniref:DUF5634 family protein n=1 Tax=Metabacillus schmidteae TaxID=2730405 RepID=UPI000C80EC3E|nr:DUF5634 family protein [Metabacillus schmidteae]PMC34119.1 hypothetical protein CJ195_24480 [Bacillus sp. UMB0899]
MQFTNRDKVIKDLQQAFQPLIEQYGIEDIGVFEEQGQKNQYHMGYTIRKDGKTYMVHTPYFKNELGQLSAGNSEWTVETDEPSSEDIGGYKGLDEALRSL